MTLRVDYLENDIDSEIDALLNRWATWLRAGGGMGGVVIGLYDERGDAEHEEYRDLVAELVDQHIARLPPLLKGVVITLWYLNKPERQAADDYRIPRVRLRSVREKAIGWLFCSLQSVIDKPLTVDNLDRWTRG